MGKKKKNKAKVKRKIKTKRFMEDDFDKFVGEAPTLEDDFI